jgi:hypothetical protein
MKLEILMADTIQFSDAFKSEVIQLTRESGGQWPG